MVASFLYLRSPLCHSMKERKEKKTFPACDDAFQHFSALITVFTQLSHPSLPNLICFPGQSLFRPCTRIKLLFLSAVARSCARQQHSERELCESGLCVLARLRKSITITSVSGRRLLEMCSHADVQQQSPSFNRVTNWIIGTYAVFSSLSAFT